MPMNQNMHYLYDILESTRRFCFRQSLLKPPHDISHILNALHTSGYIVLENFLSPEECEQGRKDIDALCERPDKPHGFWVDPDKTDYRFFHYEDHSTVGKTFLNHPMLESVRKYFTGRRHAEKTVLGAKIYAKTGNLGSGGGWHFDSPFAQQFKAIVYLSDVDMDHGPFQYLPGSRNRSFRSTLVKKGLMKPGQYRFTDEEATAIAKEGQGITTFTAKQGTIILCNVSGLHRGMPIQTGTRYALTLYCGDPVLNDPYLKTTKG